uniref:3-hydroxyanthranilate 3,4-dioxygenase n=1 Tax=Ditylenchus dipsaci TaxID=166011 RepID=A0A915E812_9BILA
MLLKVVDKGQHRDISIKQGELFLLPACVEHSPQRFENTVGCVIERTRLKDELDCIRYFVDGSTKVLWEKWFHLEDVVKDLPPVIKEFKDSPQNKSGADSQLASPPAGSYSTDENVTVSEPIALSDFIDRHMLEINTKAPFQVYGPPTNKSFVLLYGEGVHSLSTDNSGDLIVMTMRKFRFRFFLLEGGVTRNLCSIKGLYYGTIYYCSVKANTKFSLKLPGGAVCITVKVE